MTSVAYIGLMSRTKRPRKTIIGTEVGHVTRDSDTTFKVKRSTCRGRVILWRPPAQCPRRGALNDDGRLKSVAYVGPKSRTELGRLKIGTEVAHVTRDSETTFKLSKGQGHVRGGAYCGGLRHSLFCCFRRAMSLFCMSTLPLPFVH